MDRLPGQSGGPRRTPQRPHRCVPTRRRALFSPSPKRRTALRTKRLAALLAALSISAALAAPVAAANPHGKADGKGPKTDNIPGVLAKKQTAMKQKALELVAKGKTTAKGPNKV